MKTILVTLYEDGNVEIVTTMPSKSGGQINVKSLPWNFSSEGNYGHDIISQILVRMATLDPKGFGVSLEMMATLEPQPQVS